MTRRWQERSKSSTKLTDSALPTFPKSRSSAPEPSNYRHNLQSCFPDCDRGFPAGHPLNRTDRPPPADSHQIPVGRLARLTAVDLTPEPLVLIQLTGCLFELLVIQAVAALTLHVDQAHPLHRNVSSAGSSIFDLICSKVAAITRNSPATVRFSSSIASI